MDTDPLFGSPVSTARLLVAQLNELRVRDRLSSIVAMPAVLTVVWIHFDTVPTINSFGWLVYMFLILILRMLIGKEQSLSLVDYQQLQKQGYFQMFVNALYGIGWGGLIFVLNSGNFDFLFMFKVATITAALGVTLNAMSVLFPVYLAFLVPVIGLLIIYFFTGASFVRLEDAVSCSIGLCIYGGVLAAAAQNIAKMTRMAFEQGFERDQALHETRESHARELALSKKLSDLARKDALTGVFNRRHLAEQLENNVNTLHRHQVDFSVILIDVDHFKQINDTFGHHVGDLVLIGLSKFVANALREIDVFGRWGGEEFLCILPHTQFESAMLCAERLREGLASMLFVPAHPELMVTASFGLVTCHANEGVEEVMKRVDTALYAAKSAGRNRVIGSEASAAVCQ